MFDKNVKKTLFRIFFVGTAVLLLVAGNSMATRFSPQQIKFIESSIWGLENTTSVTREKKELFVYYENFKLVPQIVEQILMIIRSGTYSSIATETQAIIYTCSLKNESNCYGRELADLTTKTDMLNAISVLHAMQNLMPALKDCHIIAHVIANAAVKKNPDKWSGLMKEVDVVECGGGFLHGVLEVHIGYEPNFTITASSIQDVCGGLGAGISHIDRSLSCAHIMGHLRLVETNGDVEKALPICRDLPRQLALRCADGIFMEDTYKLVLIDHGIVTTPPVHDEADMNRQRVRCDKYLGLEGIACWIDLGQVISRLYSFDASRTFTMCETAPDQQERRQCYLRAVLVMMSTSYFDDHAKISAVCAPLVSSDSRYRECLWYGIYGATMFKFDSRAATLCSEADPIFRSYCFSELGNQITTFGGSRDNRLAACNLHPQFLKDCMGE